MGCSVGRSMLNWLLTFVLISLLGFFLIGLSSLGSTVACKHYVLPMIATAVTLLLAAGPWTNLLLT